MIWVILLLIIRFFISVSPVFAVSVTISNVPFSITDQPFNIDVSVAGAQAGTNYLRANLFPTGTTKYFGYTYNGTSFVNSSDYSQYFPIPIDSSGNWSGTIQAKVDTNSSYYTDPGTYSLKVRRYTQSGSSYTWSNEVTLTLDLPTPTPVPSPIPTPIPSPTPSSTITATSTSISKKTTPQIISPTPVPASKSTTVPLLDKTDNSLSLKNITKNNSIASVAGERKESTASPKTLQTEIKPQKQINFPIMVGVVLVIFGFISLFYIYLQRKKEI